MPTPKTKPPEGPIFERGLWNHSWFILLLCLVFAAIDWELVPLAIFPFVFIFPVMLAAWNRGIWFALSCAVVLSLTRVARDYFLDLQPLTIDEKTAALVRFFVLTLLATLTTLLARQSRQLRQRVVLLEGILPICAGCKSIRDEQGKWLSLEGYITTHSTAQFSHGLCPVCFKNYYGEPAADKAGEK